MLASRFAPDAIRTSQGLIMAEDSLSPPSTGKGRTLSDLINPLELLYQTVLNLTEKAEEKSIDLDKQTAIEETRKAILEEADQILEEARLALSQEGDFTDTDSTPTLLDQKKERLVLLVKQIHFIDQKRVFLFKEEQAAIQQVLFQFNLGKQAVTKYQQTLPMDD